MFLPGYRSCQVTRFPCGGLAISWRPMALRTGLATGVPFSLGAERGRVATANAVGHRDIVVDPDSFQHSAEPLERLRAASVAAGEKGNRHTGSRGVLR